MNDDLLDYDEFVEREICSGILLQINEQKCNRLKTELAILQEEQELNKKYPLLGPSMLRFMAKGNVKLRRNYDTDSKR